jgi:glycosyltransferase involved in cell wall biosynthesis
LMSPDISPPRVSVILNCYNQGEWVAEAVESVIHQTSRDFELLIVDNGSTDGTPKILQNYASDPRVRLFLHQENVAISRRFNEAVSAARGEFISFLYSDDFYLPQKLERQVALFDQLGPEHGVVYGPSLVKNDLTGEQWQAPSIQYSGSIFRDMCRHLHQGPPNMIAPMTRTQLLRENPFYEDIFAEGEAVFFRVALTCKFQYDPEPLSVVRDHLKNAGKAIKVNAEIFSTCMQRIMNRNGLALENREAVARMQAGKWRDVGWTAIRIDEDAAWARSAFARAIKIRAAEVFHPRLVCGVALSLAPRALRAALNRVGNKVRGVRINSVAVEGYK